METDRVEAPAWYVKWLRNVPDFALEMETAFRQGQSYGNAYRPPGFSHDMACAMYDAGKAEIARRKAEQ